MNLPLTTFQFTMSTSPPRAYGLHHLMAVIAQTLDNVCRRDGGAAHTNSGIYARAVLGRGSLVGTRQHQAPPPLLPSLSSFQKSALHVYVGGKNQRGAVPAVAPSGGVREPHHLRGDVDGRVGRLRRGGGTVVHGSMILGGRREFWWRNRLE